MARSQQRGIPHDRRTRLHRRTRSGIYHVIYWHPRTGRRWESTHARTLADAQAYLERHRDRLGAARRGHEEMATALHRRFTVDQALDLVVAQQTDARKLRNTLAPTLRRIRDELGGVKLAALALEDVLTARRAWIREGLSDGYINQMILQFSKATRLALAQNKIPAPFRWAWPYFKEVPNDEIITAEELAAVQSCEPRPGERDVNEWAYWTAQRRGEITRILTWDRLDTVRWILRLPGRLVKTRRGRELHIPEHTIYREILERRLAARVPGCPYIFHHEGRRCSDPDRWRVAWIMAGLDTRRTRKGHLVPAKTFHRLRATGIVNMAQVAKVPLDVAMAISGHKSPAIFSRIYNHVQVQSIRDALRDTWHAVGPLPVVPSGPPTPGIERRTLYRRGPVTPTRRRPSRPASATTSARPADQTGAPLSLPRGLAQAGAP